MRMLRSNAGAAALGAITWTAAEYGLHRFAMHSLRGKGLASREHLRHHADTTYFSPTSKKLASATATTAVALPLATAAAGRRWATAFTAGMISTYFAYEIAHRRTHTHPPRNRYGSWARRNHLQHHFGAPMRNFGVTSPVWDNVFGTSDKAEIVTVPQRMAPVWLIDEVGQIRPEYVGDYVVRAGRVRDEPQLERDQVAAFANVPPET